MDKQIPLHIVAVLGFIQKGDKFLIAKRASNDPQAGGKWSIPGGKHEFEVGDNTVEPTLRREIKEEVGLEIEDGMIYIGNQSFIHSSGNHVVMLFFLCKYKTGKAEPLEDQEEIRWVTLAELEKPVNSKGGPDYLIEPVKRLKALLK